MTDITATGSTVDEKHPKKQAEPNEESKSYCFIVDQIDVDAKLPIELISGYRFDRATTEQIAFIKEQQQLLKVFGMHAMFYENDMVETMDESRGIRSGRNVELPPEKWRYWVITFPEWGSELELLGYGAALLKQDLHFGMAVCYQAGFPGASWRGGFELGYYSQPFPVPFRAPVLKSPEIMEIGANYRLMKKAETCCPRLLRIAHRFNYLRALPQHSEFAFVAYFSVLESIVTHKPKETDTFDSINHQLKTKMELLSKKFERTLDYSVFEGKLSRDKVWTLLYSYRSQAAHGGEADFKKELKHLRGPHVALAFLKEALKLTILCALNEPEFMIDLQRC